jgi:hypothetical protein
MVLEFPETELVRRSFTIRKMDFPQEVLLTKRSLVRWFALSSGLISPKESRSGVLDVLDALFYFQISKRKFPKISELNSYLVSQKKKIGEKALRYHLARLFNLGLLEWRGKRISFSTNPMFGKDDISKGFEYSVSKNVIESLELIKSCLEEIRKKYS